MAPILKRAVVAMAVALAGFILEVLANSPDKPNSPPPHS